MAKRKKAESKMYFDPVTGRYGVTLGDDGENWMAEHRLEQLRARGWRGTLGQWIDAWELIDADPLEQTPPITGTMTKMEWTLNDGTTVSSDGLKITVTGKSRFAKYLRHQLAEHKIEHHIRVDEFLPPSAVPLAPSRARNVNAWIEREIYLDDLPRPRRHPVSVTSRPYIEPLPPAPDDDGSGRQPVY